MKGNAKSVGMGEMPFDKCSGQALTALAVNGQMLRNT
jgi:hypothetical protein